MTHLKVNVKTDKPERLPKYQTSLSAGMDLHADLQESITLKPLERVLIPTGLYIELPEGYEAQIRPRSGLAYKHGLTVLNSPGTIDADFRGELKVLLVNLSNQEYTINDNERVAQMVVASHSQVDWNHVDQLEDTVRGAGGFASTGK